MRKASFCLVLLFISCHKENVINVPDCVKENTSYVTPKIICRTVDFDLEYSWEARDLKGLKMVDCSCYEEKRNVQ